MMATITNADILVCIVLYNQTLPECNTFKTILEGREYSDLHILVYDNSPVALTDIFSIKTGNFTFYYWHNVDNAGVAGAYNYSAKLAKSIEKKFLFLFDQDTLLANDYFSKMFESINANNQINLFSPVNMDKKKVISPSRYYLGRPFLLSKIAPGITVTKNYTLINSGLAISVEEFFKLDGYDMELKLDFSDHYFFYKYRKSNNFFCVVNAINIQEFSTFHEIGYEKTLARFKTYIKGALYFSKKTKSLFPFVWGLLRGTKLSLMYKKKSFIAYTLHLFRN